MSPDAGNQGRRDGPTLLMQWLHKTGVRCESDGLTSLKFHEVHIEAAMVGSEGKEVKNAAREVDASFARPSVALQIPRFASFTSFPSLHDHNNT